MGWVCIRKCDGRLEERTEWGLLQDSVMAVVEEGGNPFDDVVASRTLHGNPISRKAAQARHGPLLSILECVHDEYTWLRRWSRSRSMCASAHVKN